MTVDELREDFKKALERLEGVDGKKEVLALIANAEHHARAQRGDWGGPSWCLMFEVYDDKDHVVLHVG